MNKSVGWFQPWVTGLKTAKLPTLLTVNIQKTIQTSFLWLILRFKQTADKVIKLFWKKAGLLENNKELSSDKRERREEFSKETSRPFAVNSPRFLRPPSPFLQYFSGIPSQNPFPFLSSIKESDSFLLAHFTSAFSREPLRTLRNNPTVFHTKLISVYDTAAVTAVRISGRIFQPVSYPQWFLSAQKSVKILLCVTVRLHPFSNYYFFQNYIRLLKFKTWHVTVP